MIIASAYALQPTHRSGFVLYYAAVDQDADIAQISYYLRLKVPIIVACHVSLSVPVEPEIDIVDCSKNMTFRLCFTFTRPLPDSHLEARIPFRLKNSFPMVPFHYREQQKLPFCLGTCTYAHVKQVKRTKTKHQNSVLELENVRGFNRTKLYE